MDANATGQDQAGDQDLQVPVGEAAFQETALPMPIDEDADQHGQQPDKSRTMSVDQKDDNLEDSKIHANPHSAGADMEVARSGQQKQGLVHGEDMELGNLGQEVNAMMHSHGGLEKIMEASRSDLPRLPKRWDAGPVGAST